MLITSANKNLSTGESVVFGFEDDEKGKSQMIAALRAKTGIHRLATNEDRAGGFAVAEQLVATWRARGDAVAFA